MQLIAVMFAVGCLATSTVLGQDCLRIGAFNIQTFGRTKLGKQEVMNHIVQIVQRYDVILIQEIRDISGDVISECLDMLNSDGLTRWGVTASGRLGRTSYKEQYAYFYRQDRMTLTSVYQFDDGEDDGSDWFEREPFAAMFYSALSEPNDFVLIGIHVKPDDAVAETNYLTHVYEATSGHFGIEDILIMGDFNADCSYVRDFQWESISLRMDPRFTWLISDEVDTTVSSTDCAYDRIVATGINLLRSIEPGSAQVFHFDQAFGLDYDMTREISDHYPVEVQVCAPHQASLYAEAQLHRNPTDTV